jgi:DHA2 family multidrug resistance protein
MNPSREAVRTRPLAVVAVSLISFVEVLNTAMLVVALPSIARSFSTNMYRASWVLASYFVASALVLPIAGWLGRFFGPKRALIAAALGFSAASLFCGLAPTMPMLILFSVIQGLMGGILLPLTQAEALKLSPPERANSSMAVFGFMSLAAPILGSMLGGYLASSLSWRWIFYLDIAAGMVWTLMARRFIPRPRRNLQWNTLVDFRSMGLLALAIGSLFVMFEIGGGAASAFEVVLALTSLLAFLTFGMRAARSEDPLLQLRLLKRGTFSGGLLLTAGTGFALYGSHVLVSVFLQVPLGYSAIKAGTNLALRGLGTLCIVPIVGVLSRSGPRKLLAAGMTTASGTLYLFSTLSRSSSPLRVSWLLVMLGATTGLIYTPLSIAALDRIVGEDMDSAFLFVNILRHLSVGCGILVLIAFVTRRQELVGAFSEGFRGLAGLVLLCLPLVLMTRARGRPGLD